MYVHVYLYNMHTNMRPQLSVTPATEFLRYKSIRLRRALVFSKVSAACVLATISHFSLPFTHTHTHAIAPCHCFPLNALTASEFACAILLFVFLVFAFFLTTTEVLSVCILRA